MDRIDFDTEVVRRGNKGSSVSTKMNCPPAQKNERSRLMCFTRFAVEDPIKFDPTSMVYMGYGLEVCPSTGRQHHQGFVYWRSARWTHACAKKFKSFFAACKGNLQQQKAYCSKDGTYVEFGKAPAQGERSDIQAIVNEILHEGLRAEELLATDSSMYHQYGRTFLAAEDYAMRRIHRTEMTTCTWYYGPTGVGKSHAAFADYDESTHYLYPKDGDWWDAYRQQDTVIINEFRGEIKFNFLLELIDKWPVCVRRRGREPMPFVSKHIIITSALAPWEVYSNVCTKSDNVAQLLRRVNVVQLTHSDGGSAGGITDSAPPPLT